MAHHDPHAGPEGAAAGEDAPVPQYRGLKAAVVIMGFLLVAGFIVVFSTIIYRVVKPSPGSLAARDDTPFAVETLVPAGSQAGRIVVDGDRLTVEVTGPDGTEIVIYDLRKGAEEGRIRLKSR